jgi:hypothetical protein
MVDLGDGSDRTGSHNTLALKADDLVGSSSAATIGPVGSSHDINFFIIGDDKGATSADRDGVHLTTGFGAAPAPIATGIAYVDPVTGISHNYDVYQSATHPEIKVAIEHGLDVTT